MQALHADGQRKSYTVYIVDKFNLCKKKDSSLRTNSTWQVDYMYTHGVTANQHIMYNAYYNADLCFLTSTPSG